MQKQGVADRLKKLLGIAATQAGRPGRWLVNALIVALRGLWWLISPRWIGRLLCSIWRSIPNYLPFYLTVKDRPLPFGGETIANELLDALNSLQDEAAGREKSGVRTCAPGQPDQKEELGAIAPRETLVEVPAKFAVEVKGISVQWGTSKSGDSSLVRQTVELGAVEGLAGGGGAEKAADLHNSSALACS
jgi:hypothetical protein